MPQLGFGDLALCAGTAPGADFIQLVEAAAAAGCAAVSPRPGAVLQAVKDAGSAAMLRRRLRDAQVAVADLDALVDWAPGGWDRVPAFIPREGRMDGEHVLELAASVGARSVNAVDLCGDDLPVEALAEAFAGLCDRAAGYGLLAHVEFFGGSSVKDLAVAARIVELAGRVNGGVLLDTFHYHRGATRAEGQLGGDLSRITMLQASDASAVPAEDPWRERLAGRLLPGEGAIDLVGLLRRLREAGCDAPIGLEVNNAALHRLPPPEAARQAADAMRGVLARLDAPALNPPRPQRTAT